MVFVVDAEVGGDGAVDLADEVSFEAAHDHLVGASFGQSSGHVGLGRWVPAESADDDDVERPVGVAIAVAVKRTLLIVLPLTLTTLTV